MTEFLFFSFSQQTQPQKVNLLRRFEFFLWIWKTQHKKRDVSFCLLNFSEYFGISVIIVVIMLNMMCSMMQLEKLLNTMKFFLDFFFLNFFFLRSWIIFFNLDFFLIFFWFVGEKKQIFLFSGFFDYYLDNFEMTRINAPFSSLNRWLSFFRCSSCFDPGKKLVKSQGGLASSFWSPPWYSIVSRGWLFLLLLLLLLGFRRSSWCRHFGHNAG